MTDQPSQRGRWSLRQRLLVLLGSLVLVLLAAASTAFYLDARKASQQLFDNAMEGAARLILQLAEHEIAEHGQVLGVQLLDAETRPGPFPLRFQVWTEDMRQGLRSQSLVAQPLLGLQAEGFDWVSVKGERWRSFAVWNLTHTIQVQLIESPQQRQALVHETQGHLMATVLVLVVLAGACVAWILLRTVQPVARVANAVARRSPEDLSPLHEPDAPAEVQPLLTALNQLLRRFGEKLASEQRFTADASHELRTPLAAIKVNAQVLVGARDDSERQSASEGLLASVDRSARLVDQLLALARADAKGHLVRGQLPETSLDELARAQLREHSDAAARKALTLTLDAVPARVRGDAPLLAILLRNLVDNAIRYTPAGGVIRIGVAPGQDGPLLTVTDSGPGIPPASRKQVFERFYRLPGSTAGGSGLGLSIVARIAALHDAKVGVETAEDGHGARFEVRFPAA